VVEAARRQPAAGGEAVEVRGSQRCQVQCTAGRRGKESLSPILLPRFVWRREKVRYVEEATWYALMPRSTAVMRGTAAKVLLSRRR